jgi:hypothetical protein
MGTRQQVFCACAALWVTGCQGSAAEEEEGSSVSAALLSPGLAFTQQCQNQLTTADETLFRQAVDLIRVYQYAVEGQISRGRAAGNPDSYTAIPSEKMALWRGGVAEMLFGGVKVACEYNATSNRCNNGPGLFGWTFDWDPFVPLYDRVHICIDNVRTLSVGGSTVALVAGVLSHELMHHVDGVESHGPGGFTSAQNPDTAAETIGVAMEHLIMTPDLRASIKSITSSFLAPNHSVLVDVEVENVNPQANIGLVAQSTTTRNQTTNVSLQVDGVTVASLPVSPLNGLATTVAPFQIAIPAYDASADPDYVLFARADSGFALLERDELNNESDSATFSTAVDLSIAVEISGPPVCHSVELRQDAYPPGYYSWFEIPYRAAITNLEASTYAATSDVVMMYEDMWTDSAMTSQQEMWLAALAPAETREVAFRLEVPTDGACSGPVGATEVSFIADWNATSVFDVDRGNNAVAIVVDAGYWKPDYVITAVSRQSNLAVNANRLTSETPEQEVSIDDRSTVSYTIRNVGPKARGQSTTSHTRVVDPAGVSVFSASIANLAPGAERAFEVNLPAACDPVTYTIEADYGQTVAESNEGNNTTRVTIESSFSALGCDEDSLVLPACGAVCAPTAPCGTPCRSGGEDTTCQAVGECGDLWGFGSSVATDRGTTLSGSGQNRPPVLDQLLPGP